MTASATPLTFDAASAPVFDRARLEELKSMLGSALAEVLRAWLVDVPALIAALQAACDRCDAAQAIITAHALKGSCSNVGALRLQALARDIEHRLRDQPSDCSAASIALAQLHAEYENAAGFIRTRLDR
ncbi:Hpt domain-containing protein [Methyloversatilis universalis]|uniref:Hpt domain-containing protein n=1 Tax=Methyloversatilis universalis TaxID=378211 RepID=UPI00037C78AF|nr:Hpt domain-containing protein [Methyloversatilis universalis]